MSKFYTSNFPIINLHKKASSRSEIVTQMIFGDTLFPSQSPLQSGKIKALMIAAGMRGKAGLAMEIMMMGL